MLTVDRKYKEPWSGKLPTRFMIISNRSTWVRAGPAGVKGVEVLDLDNRAHPLGRMRT